MTLDAMAEQARTLGYSPAAMLAHYKEHVSRAREAIPRLYADRNRMARCTGHHTWTRRQIVRRVTMLRQEPAVLAYLLSLSA